MDVSDFSHCYHPFLLQRFQQQPNILRTIQLEFISPTCLHPYWRNIHPLPTPPNCTKIHSPHHNEYVQLRTAIIRHTLWHIPWARRTHHWKSPLCNTHLHWCIPRYPKQSKIERLIVHKKDFNRTRLKSFLLFMILSVR